MWHTWERREKCTRFSWERDHVEDQGGIRMVLRESGWRRGVEWTSLAQDR
jgi:hypothetical protein